MKIARKYTKRQGVVSFTRGFHGRTNMTMSMTSKVKPYKFGFGPFASEVYQAPFPYYYQKPAGMSDESYDDMVIQAFNDFFIASVAPETVACVVMEPVQEKAALSFLRNDLCGRRIILQGTRHCLCR